MHEKLTAVVWDFDGTLVDTRRKNMNVARALVEHLTERSADEFPALRTLPGYERALHRHRNWREFYRVELQMKESDIDRTAQSWLDFQLEDDTAAETYDGIHEVLATFSHVPQGIVSLNLKDNILRFLEQLELAHHFDRVYGAECVQPGLQKPHPDALLRCIEGLTGGEPGFVVYIGDHETDVECAHNANVHFEQAGVDLRIVSVGALYAPHIDDEHWQVEPDCKVGAPHEIVSELARVFARFP